MIQGTVQRLVKVTATATLWLAASCHAWAQVAGTPSSVPETPAPQDETGSTNASGVDHSWLNENVAETVQIPTIQNASYWANAEYLLWWMQPGHTPPLVTTGPADQPLAGALGQPGTQVVNGGNLNSLRNGGRFTLGGWLGDSHTLGIEASYFFLTSGTQNFFASSSDDPNAPVLARPFFNPITNSQDREIVLGNVQTISTSTFQGAALNLLSFPCLECCSCPCGTVPMGYTLGWAGGFSYLRLTESLQMTENLNFSLTDPVAGGVTNFNSRLDDRFSVSNNFYGIQFGPRVEWYRGSWFFNGSGQLALGVNQQIVNIQGSTTFYSPTPGGPFPGGFYALPSNIGSYSRDVFAVVPQINLSVGRQITQNFRLFIGYNFLYFSNVVRPGDQIDSTLNVTQLPSSSGPSPLIGPARPAFQFHDTGMWVQGLNFGAQFLY